MPALYYNNKIREYRGLAKLRCRSNVIIYKGGAKKWALLRLQTLNENSTEFASHHAAIE